VNTAKLLVAALVVVSVVGAGVLVAWTVPRLGGPGDGVTSPAPGTPGTPRTTETPPGTAAGAPLLSTGFESDRPLDNWTVTAEAAGDAAESEGEVSVADGQLWLRVFRCHRVVAERDLGRVDGRLRVSFEWATAAEGWYERPDWHLVAANGSVLNYTVVEGRDVTRPNESSSRGGRLVATATADGPVTLRFLVRPSQYCARANHRNTTLWVDDLTVTVPA
jgi:hypothetical protein